MKSLRIRVALYIVMLCALCGVSHGAQAFVKKGSATCSAVTACAVTISPAAGNQVYVELLDNGTATTRTATDSASSTYTSSFSAACAPTGGTFGCMLSRAPNALAATTVTCNVSPADSLACIVLEYSGGATSSDQDVQGALATGSSTTQTAGSMTTTNANDLLLHFVMQGTNNTTVFATSGSYTNRASQACTACGAVLGENDQIVTATAAYSTVSSTAISVNWWARGTAFKASGGAAPAAFYPPRVIVMP
jgi:hypothetical protein